VHSYGGVVFHDVLNQGFARKAVEKGADGRILVAAGAGGHAGTTSPFAFVEETRQWFTGPIALSGSIATGQAILAAEAIGADFAYIGSAFIATTEANAASDYKQAIVGCNSNDIVYPNLFTGVHGNNLRPSIAASGLDPENLPESDPSSMNFGSGGKHGQESLEGYLGIRTGHRRNPADHASWRIRRSPRAGIFVNEGAACGIAPRTTAGAVQGCVEKMARSEADSRPSSSALERYLFEIESTQSGAS
jgi:NAD(P)H-dependent flavin oxidoreductase YrpB (nitropropane dioxygenase family)